MSGVKHHLSNGGEEIQIIDSVGENVLEFSYRDDWDDQTNQDGYAFSLRDPLGTPVDNGDGTETLIIRDVLVYPAGNQRFIRLSVAPTSWEPKIIP